MYKLIGSPKTRAFRVLWMIEELGLECELENVPPRSDPAVAANPSGKIPSFSDDGTIIIDSTAIIQYLADKHGQLTFKAGTLERAHQDSFTQFGLDDMDGILWTAAKHTFIFPEEKRAAGAVDACIWDFNNAMSVFGKRLGSNQFVMGDVFTVPDIVIGHCAGWASNMGIDWPEGAVSDYFERVRSRPAFRKAWEIRENA